ncbi:Phloem protein 2-like [Macleaya cordata]|uniref:Phloem protein 2-like n=1 Tax=Macleaya cordata TaxID=56857 RepID=A0A200QPK2_MACCD|nr:Phloem protein 2-like [Macleaya cordata]
MASAHQRGNPLIGSNFRVVNIHTFYPGALNVIWGGSSTNGRYWKKVKEGSDEVLQLVGVYWLEVSGKLLLSRFKPGATYRLYFRIKMIPEASGWDNYDVIFNLRLTGQRSKQKSIKLNTFRDGQWYNVPNPALEFTVPDKKTLDSQSNMALTFAMYEIECEDLKSGLVIESVRIEEVKN